MNWISVEDQIPPQRKACLLYQSFPHNTAFNCLAKPLEREFIILGGLYYGKHFVSYSDQYNPKGLKYITHWMPLPEPPKKDETV